MLFKAKMQAPNTKIHKRPKWILSHFHYIKTSLRLSYIPSDKMRKWTDTSFLTSLCFEVHKLKCYRLCYGCTNVYNIKTILQIVVCYENCYICWWWGPQCLPLYASLVGAEVIRLEYARKIWGFGANFAGCMSTTQSKCLKIDTETATLKCNL